MIEADLNTTKSMLKKIKAMGIDEALMTIGDQKLHTRVVDPVHVSMLDMTLHLKKCKYKPIHFGMELESLTSRIKFLPAGNKKDSPENILKIRPKIEVKDKDYIITNLQFFHPMLKFDKKPIDTAGIADPNIPKKMIENYEATANINKRQFSIFLKIAEAETDHICFIAEQKKNKLSALFDNDENEIVSTDLTYSLGGIEGIDLKFLNKKVKKVKALFSVDFMINTINLINAPTIKIMLKNDYPISIWWKEGELLEGVYFLAPRIESE